MLKTYPQEWAQEVPLLAPRGQLDQPVLKRKVNPKMNELWWSGHDMIENFFGKKRNWTWREKNAQKTTTQTDITLNTKIFRVSGKDHRDIRCEKPEFESSWMQSKPEGLVRLKWRHRTKARDRERRIKIMKGKTKFTIKDARDV